MNNEQRTPTSNQQVLWIDDEHRGLSASLDIDVWTRGAAK